MLPLLEVSVPAYSAHHTCARVRSIDALKANIDELKSEKDKLPFCAGDRGGAQVQGRRGVLWADEGGIAHRYGGWRARPRP